MKCFYVKLKSLDYHEEACDSWHLKMCWKQYQTMVSFWSTKFYFELWTSCQVFLHEILNTLCRSKQTKDGEASTVSGSLLCNFRCFNRTHKKVRAFPLQFDSQRNGFVESKKSNKQSIFCDQISTVHINRKRYLPALLCIFSNFSCMFLNRNIFFQFEF